MIILINYNHLCIWKQSNALLFKNTGKAQNMRLMTSPNQPNWISSRALVSHHLINMIIVIISVINHHHRHYNRHYHCHPECDVPVPGIPGSGNFSFFWWYRNPYRNKFGSGNKSRNRYQKNFVPEQKLGTGIGKIWYQNWFLSPKFRNLEDL